MVPHNVQFLVLLPLPQSMLIMLVVYNKEKEIHITIFTIRGGKAEQTFLGIKGNNIKANKTPGFLV